MINKVKVRRNGIVCIDGIPVCRRIVGPDGSVRLVAKGKTNSKRTLRRRSRLGSCGLDEFITVVTHIDGRHAIEGDVKRRTVRVALWRNDISV